MTTPFGGHDFECVADRGGVQAAKRSEEGIVEIVAVIALFGWLNRWNDTFASDLEDAPRAFAEAHLAARGWSVGKHGDKGRPPD